MRIKTPYENKTGRVFSFLSLLFSFSLGVITPILPNFVKTFVGTDENTSLFFSALALVVLISSVTSTLIFKKISRTKMFKLSLLVCGITFVLLPFIGSTWELVAVKFIQSWFVVIVWIALSLFVFDYTKKQNLGNAEGTYYFFSNIGYLLGPITGGYAATLLGYEAVFYIAAGAVFLALLYFMHKHLLSKHKDIKTQENKPYTESFTRNITGNTLRFFKNKERAKAYLISLGLNVWFCFKYTYIPLYIAAKGFESSVTGIVFTAGIVPLILLEKYAGSYADKHGYKKPIVFGFLFYSFTLFLAYAMNSPLATILLLIIANFGTSIVEPLKDVYVLKNMRKEDEENFFGVFKTSEPAGYFIAPLIGAAVFMFGSYELLFLVFALINLLLAGLLIMKKHASPCESPQE